MAGETTGVLGYHPSLALAVIGTIVFSAAAFYHIFLFARQKTWCFYVMIIVLLMETAAFGCRAYSSVHPDQARVFMFAYELLILAPSTLAIVFFKLFVRLTWFMTPNTQRKFSKTWVPSSIFVSGFRFLYKISMLSQFASLGGIIGAYPTPISTTPNNPHALDIGIKMMKFGLVVQAICIGLFLVVSLHWTWVASKWSPTGVTDETTPMSWKRLAFAINLSSVLIIFRTIYRVFEFSPESSPIISEFVSTHEFTFWICDVLPVLAVIAIFAVYHPGYCLPRTFTVFWMRERKIKKLEKKILESQTLPSHSQPQPMLQSQPAGMPQIPVYAYMPKH